MKLFNRPKKLSKLALYDYKYYLQCFYTPEQILSLGITDIQGMKLKDETIELRITLTEPHILAEDFKELSVFMDKVSRKSVKIVPIHSNLWSFC